MKYSIRAYYCEGENYTSVPIKNQGALKRIDGYAIYQDNKGEDMHVSDHKEFDVALQELIKLRERRMGFVNGFGSWHETHFEIVTAINDGHGTSEKVTSIQAQYGHGGLFELAQELTDEFEKKYKGITWGEDEIDGEVREWYDVIEEFCEEKLK